MKNKVQYIYYKRIIDIVISVLLLLIFWPLMLLVYLLIYINLGIPVVFSQKRAGYKNIIFTIFKFRTMNNDVDHDENLLPDHKRCGSFGNFIRKYSIDELPQLWNVIKGDMSLVGPRPLPVKYLPLYNENQINRHNVKPGITGWAQINGRNSISWEEKFSLDLFYIHNISFWLDCKILLLTVKKVFASTDINNSTEVTMKAFIGTGECEKKE